MDQEAKDGTDVRGRGRRGTQEIFALLSSILFLVVGACYATASEAQPGQWHAYFLLALSSLFCGATSVLSLIIREKPIGKLLWVFGIFEVTKALLLGLLMLLEPVSGSAPDRPWLARAIIIMSLLAMVAVAAASLGQIGRVWGLASSKVPHRVSHWVSVAMPVASMGCLFLCATYFMTFALVAHHRSEPGGALRGGPVPLAGSPSDERLSWNVCPETGQFFRLRFPPGTASLRCLAEDPFAHPDNGSGHDDCAAAEVQEAQLNEKALRALAQCLERMDLTQPVRLTLVAHASEGVVRPPPVRSAEGSNQEPPRKSRNRGTTNPDLVSKESTLESRGADGPEGEPVEGLFGSDYELTLARAQWTQALLTKFERGLRLPHGAQWLLIPSPDDRSAGRSQHFDLVEVRVQALASKALPLSLLDHLYFMVYTITTTGYGDLAPRTPLSKFLTTIANLFEVFFFVIAVNVVIGLVLPKGQTGHPL